MTFSPTRAPGTRQLLLTNFIWVPVCIKNPLFLKRRVDFLCNLIILLDALWHILL